MHSEDMCIRFHTVNEASSESFLYCSDVLSACCLSEAIRFEMPWPRPREQFSVQAAVGVLCCFFVTARGLQFGSQLVPMWPAATCPCVSLILVVHRCTVPSCVIIAHILWMRRRLESPVIVTNSHRLGSFLDSFVCYMVHPARESHCASGKLIVARMGRTGGRGSPLEIRCEMEVDDWIMVLERETPQANLNSNDGVDVSVVTLRSHWTRTDIVWIL